MANKKRDIEISPHEDGGWQVIRQGGERASSRHARKVDADKVARGMARRDEVELVIKGKDGRIQDKDSFGNDPCPPRDKKH